MHYMCDIIDAAFLFDPQIGKKEGEKIDEYNSLRYEIARI